MSPASPNEEDTTSSCYLPPPVGEPVAQATARPPAPEPPRLPRGVTSWASYAQPADGEPGATPTATSEGPEHGTGTNRLATAALWCGIGGFIPVAAVAAVVLGVVALRQMGRVVRGGKASAVAGVVLGSVWVVGWVAILALGATGAPQRDADTGALTPGARVEVVDLQGGDCFDGLPASADTTVTAVTGMPCAGSHEAQVGTTLTLPDQPWPGRDQAAALAQDACSTKVGRFIRDQDHERVALTVIYPSTLPDWRRDRGVSCVLVADDGGRLTGTVLKNR
ncbi:septum formation family protein [Intrasporangium sp. YIM S08009]|uniref:septum formation family protein n=1 Tax=Intrasporangium zincisolvens TaxID=3080018 RepID=UPI002B061B9A|nr:DUF4190 domain-containing protein [Intrasporangium sp. YIM S08009]